MKVTGPGPSSAVSAAKRKSSVSGGSGAFTLDVAQSASSAVATSSTAALQSVDAILALQSVGDFTEAKKRATSRAHNLLDVLDELKIALLDGGLPKTKLVALMNLLQDQRDDTNDASLEAVLDEVEVRAAVELAKFG